MSQLAFFQGAEIGLLEAPLHPGTPVGLAFWLLVLLGAAVQAVIRLRGRTVLARWGFPALLAAGLLGCDIACQCITGWDLLLPLLAYFALLWLLAGALLVNLFHFLRNILLKRV